MMIRNCGIGLGLALIAALSLAAAPRALAPGRGGLWQVAHSAKGAPEASLCVAEPVDLAQWEHRGAKCDRTLVTDQAAKAVITYTCSGGGFGRSEMTLLTPRTMRIATQGISAGEPFNYVLHARRIGDCTPR